MKKSFLFHRGFYALVFVFLAALCSDSLRAQSPTYTADRERAISLVNAKNYAEAVVLLEKLSADTQADEQIFLGLGLSYWRMQDGIKDQSKWKQTRLKARDAFIKARDLGPIPPEVNLLLAGIRNDGGDKSKSDNPQAQAAMDEAIKYFAAGNYQKAVVEYEKAATLDPTLYEAALYTGNTFYALKEYDKAGKWFAKAIAIDPHRETAHRYWGDGLMNSGNNKEAEEKFLDAIIAEPYNSAAWRGLSQYAQQKGIKLSHAKVDIPVDVSQSANGNMSITLGMGDKDDDGSFAWTIYGISRAAWRAGDKGKISEHFAKAYPNEKVYRHSLAEEMDALKMVLTTLKGNKDVKKLNPSLAMLKQLNDDGVLEAYILLARADAGIRRDYEAYRQTNREKLRLYLTKYILKDVGN